MISIRKRKKHLKRIKPKTYTISFYYKENKEGEWKFHSFSFSHIQTEEGFLIKVYDGLKESLK